MNTLRFNRRTKIRIVLSMTPSGNFARTAGVAVSHRASLGPLSCGTPTGPVDPQSRSRDRSALGGTPLGQRKPSPDLTLRRSILLICAGALISPLDSAVNIAFPSIVEAFAISPSEIQWVVISFVIAQSLASLAFGRVGDVYGHGRVFAFGLFCSVLAHWAVAQSQAFGTLILTRAIQGGAIGMAVACAPALIASAAGPARTASMLALYSACLSAGFVMGPLAGGVLVQFFGWQGVFQFRVVWSVVVLGLLPLCLQTGVGPGPYDRSRASMGRPVIAWGVLRSRRFLALQGSALILYMATFSILLWVPFLLARWSEVSVSLGGIVLAAFPLGAFAASLRVARASQPPGPSYSVRLVQSGLTRAALGLGATALCALFDNTLFLAAALFFCGTGLGRFQSGYMEQTMRWLPADNSGLAGSLLTFIRLGGLVLGVPLLSVLGTWLGIAATLAVSAVLIAVWAWVGRWIESAPCDPRA